MPPDDDRTDQDDCGDEASSNSPPIGRFEKVLAYDEDPEWEADTLPYFAGVVQFEHAAIALALPLGAAASVAVIHAGDPIDAALITGWVSYFCAASIIEFRSGRILNLLTYPGMVLAVLLSLWAGGDWRSILGGALIAIAIAVPAAVSGRVGMGALKLLLVMGLLLGIPYMVSGLLLSVVLGTAPAIMQRITDGYWREVPSGWAIAAGTGLTFAALGASFT